MSVPPDNALKAPIRRPELPDDEPFLFELYASTRKDELELTRWDVASKQAFLKMQFKAMRHGYMSQYPSAEYLVILLRDRPIGRLVVERTAQAISVVDISFLPEYRGKGIGTGLLRDLLAEASREQKRVCLHVLKQNQAVRLYERLGFQKVQEDEVYQRMEWRPQTC